MMDAHHIWGIAAVVFAIAAPIPYIVTIYRGQTRPHPCSWIIWTLLNVIAVCAQVAGGAGPGAWVTVASGFMALILAVLGVRLRHGITFHRSDWIAFGLALTGFPLWMLTDQPLAASIVVTIVNFMAYVPTMRKAWHHPQTENWFSYFLHWCKCAAGLLAMAHFNPTTAMFPGLMLICNTILIGIILSRRKTAP